MRCMYGGLRLILAGVHAVCSGICKVVFLNVRWRRTGSRDAVQQSVSSRSELISAVAMTYPMPHPINPSPPHCLVGYRMTSRRLLVISVDKEPDLHTYSRSEL